MRSRLWIVIAGCGLVAGGALGCSGGKSGGGGGGSITLTLDGGVVFLAANSSQRFASAEFYSSVSPAPTPFTLEFGTDTCELSTTSTSGNPTVTSRSVGSTVSFTSGATTIVATKDTSSGITYGVFEGIGAPLGADYTVAVSGTAGIAAGTIGTLHVPLAAVLTGTPTLTPGSPSDIVFTPNTGADYVTVQVSNAGDTVSYSCNSKDDGSFTIPANVTSAVGATGQVSVQSIKFGKITFDGKEVVLVGLTF